MLSLAVRRCSHHVESVAEEATHLEVAVHSASNLLGIGRDMLPGGRLTYAESVLSEKFTPYVVARWANDESGMHGTRLRGSDSSDFQDEVASDAVSPTGLGLVAPAWNGHGLALPLRHDNENLCVVSLVPLLRVVSLPFHHSHVCVLVLWCDMYSAQLLRIEIRDAPAASNRPQHHPSHPVIGLCDVIVTLPSPSFAMACRSASSHLVPLCLPQAGTDVPEEPAAFIFDGTTMRALHNQARSAQVSATPSLCAVLVLCCAVLCCRACACACVVLCWEVCDCGVISLSLTNTGSQGVWSCEAHPHTRESVTENHVPRPHRRVKCHNITREHEHTPCETPSTRTAPFVVRGRTMPPSSHMHCVCNMTLGIVCCVSGHHRVGCIRARACLRHPRLLFGAAAAWLRRLVGRHTIWADLSRSVQAVTHRLQRLHGELPGAVCAWCPLL